MDHDASSDGPATPGTGSAAGRLLPLPGSAGFGGPVALVEYMHRDLVERRGWISDDEYREGLALANLFPRPLAAQLAFYLGFVHYRSSVPPWSARPLSLLFLIVVAIGWAYVASGDCRGCRRCSTGRGRHHRDHRLERVPAHPQDHGPDPLLWVIFAAMAAITAITETERIELFPIAGLAVWAARSPRLRRWGAGTASFLAMPFVVQSSATPRHRVWGTSSGSSSRPVPSCSAAASPSSRSSTAGRRRVRVARPPAVRRCGRRRHDHPGPGRDHHRFIGYLVAGFPGASVAASPPSSPPSCSPCYPPPIPQVREPTCLGRHRRRCHRRRHRRHHRGGIVLGRRAITDVATAPSPSPRCSSFGRAHDASPNRSSSH